MKLSKYNFPNTKSLSDLVKKMRVFKNENKPRC